MSAATDAAIEAARAYDRVPDRQALGRLLEAFFAGPIEPETAARLDADLRALLSDRDRRAATSDAFVGNSARYFGQAWKELVSHHRLPPAPAELALWLAVTTQGYPAPRPYCPPALAGAWRQVEPAPAAWRLADDGALHTDDPHFAERDRWCLHHTAPDDPELDTQELTMTGGRAPRTALVIRELTPTALRGFRTGLDGAITHRWERA